MSGVAKWLDPGACPLGRPPLDSMDPATRELHAALDAHARRSGLPYLHPDEPTVQLNLFGSQHVESNGRKGRPPACFSARRAGRPCRRSTRAMTHPATGALIARLRDLEHARAALACDSGMQATALVFDVLMARAAMPCSCGRSTTRPAATWNGWLPGSVAFSCTIVDDGDWDGLEGAIGPQTAFVFAERFTNPLVRAQDIARLVAGVAAARERAPGLRLVIDSTIATPWAFWAPLLDQGVDVVLGSGTRGARWDRSRSVGLHCRQRRESGQ